MSKKNIIFILAVLVTALFLTSCQESILEDPQEELTDNGLFLKSAQEGEEASMLYIDNNVGGKFYFPDDILFSIKDDEAKIVNQLLLVDDYHVFDNKKEAVFRVINPGDSPLFLGHVNGQDTYSSYTKNVTALKIPFEKDDVGLQGNEGNDRFNGLLKAGQYVLSIKGREVFIYDLNSQSNYIAIGNYNGETLSFKIQSQDWILSYYGKSPIGNVFKLQTPFGELTCYTLMR